MSVVTVESGEKKKLQIMKIFQFKSQTSINNFINETPINKFINEITCARDCIPEKKKQV